MSFFTNCITSFFPDSFSINSDASSNGYRLYSSFSEIIENVYYESFIVSRFGSFVNKVYQVGHVYRISLDVKDSRELKNAYTSWPVVFSNEKRLELITDFVDFFNSPPESFSLSIKSKIHSWKIWESNNKTVFNSINDSEYLTIDLSGIDSFFRITPSKPTPEDLAFSQNYVVSIEGFDDCYNEVSEDIVVLAKEIYTTKYKYRELTSVDWDGFTGDFSIYLTTKKQNDKSFVSETDYGSFVKTRKLIKFNLFSDSNYSYLRNELVKDRFPGSRHLSYGDRFLFLLDRALLDADGNKVVALDYCRDPKSKLFYVLCSNNKLHCYKSAFHPISNLSKVVSENTYVRFETNPSRCTLHEELTFGVLFKNRRGSPENYSISRVDPDGVESWWDGSSWVATQYTFSLNTSIWKNNRIVAPSFNSHFDKFGQWEFYFQIKFKEFVDPQIIGQAVYCEYLKPVNSYSLSSSYNFDGIFLNKYRKLSVSSGLNVFELQSNFNIYTYSPIINNITFRDFIDVVEVIMPSFLAVKKLGNKNVFDVDEINTKVLNLRSGERHIFNQSTLSCSHPLFLSTFKNRENAISNKKSVIYLVDQTKISYEDYKQLLNADDYKDVEILFNLEKDETLYCFSEDDKDLFLQINSIDNDSFVRIGDNHGYV